MMMIMMFNNLLSSRRYVRIITTIIVVIFVISPSIGMVTFPTEKCYKARFLFSFKHVPGFQLRTEQYRMEITSAILNRIIAIEQTRCEGVFIKTTRTRHNYTLNNSSLNLFSTVKFTTNETVPLTNVSKKLIECIEAANDHLGNDTRLNVTGKNNRTYKVDNARMRWRESCCGRNVTPPCCHQPYSVKINQSDCACNSGYFQYSLSSKTKWPCRLCQKDHYQNQFGAASCIQCPKGTFTCGRRGASNHTSCLTECTRDFCPPTNGLTTRGEISWSNTTAGHIAHAKCPFGPSSEQATRPCTNGYWGEVNVSLCAEKPKNAGGKILQELNQLINETVTKDNAKETAVKLKNLTNKFDVKSLDNRDVTAIADLLEALVNVTDALQQTGEDVAYVFNKMLEVNESQLDGQVSKTMVNSIETLAQNLYVPANQNSVTLQTPNLIISTTKINPSSFEGLSVDLGGSSAANDKELKESLTLPQSLFENIDIHGKEETKFGSVLFLKSTLFSSKGFDDTTNTTSYLNSRVISASINGVNVQNLSTEPIIMKYQPLKTGIQGIPVCVFWDFHAQGGLGTWSRDGCDISKVENDYVICQCDHMTNFAMLFSPHDAHDETQNESHARALTIISYIGCGISLFGLTLTVVTYALFRTLRKSNQQPILACLCLSMMVLLTVFIAGVEQTKHRVGCQTVAALLHYSVLSVALWMGVEGYQMYLAFIKVLSTYHDRFMLKCCAVAWGMPAIVVIVTMATANSYYGNEQYCTLTGLPFYAAMFGPVCFIIAVNFVIFFFVTWSLGHRHSLNLRSTEQHSRRYERCLTAIAIMILLGLSWLFGALAFGGARLVFEYLFCIFNSLQGLFIFIFHCLRLKEVRSHWSTLFSKRSLRYATSVTYRRPSTVVERSASRKADGEMSKTSSIKKAVDGSDAKCQNKTDDNKNGDVQVYSNQAYDNDVA